ncbi:esterase family protein [Hymenobacter sp. BT186]|uniref:Esterase family protein n=1 Tax=Hymenobacter telluris TaxID=2816474 RepID=A0A939J9I7_9BACT|nr:alpha/beta hydrolase-fold protein [Hymenobacter telluris]MBO0357101.1 esterase family protein [Hymenobacter telluris]MBW3373128.1 esterase [Hymenobacter norwichensis]
MRREYYAWDSAALNRRMELLVFGETGARVLFFPTRKARFYDYENWGVMQALQPKIEAGLLQVYCVDSVDAESLYAFDKLPAERICRHLQYQHYILEEVLPLSAATNPNPFLIAAGCSMGAYHAINLSFRHPNLFGKVVGMSGRYDLTQGMATFQDLFQGYIDENVYLNTPNRFIPNLADDFYLTQLRRLEITLAIGMEDAFLQDNLFLSEQLGSKDITHQLYVWEKEAHNPAAWRRMVDLYL